MAKFVQLFSLLSTSETTEATTVTTAGPVISASQSMGTADIAGPWNTFALVTSTTAPPFQISMNGGAASGGNVTELVYHNHTLWQNTTAFGWFYWNTTTAAYVSFAVTAIALSNSTVPAGSASGTTVGTVSVTMSDASTFSGILALGGTNAASFSLVAGTLKTVGALASGQYAFTITATPSVVGSAFTPAQAFSVTVGTVTGRAMLTGLYNGGAAENPAWHTYMGGYPDFTANNSYMGMTMPPTDGGENPATNGTYPMILNAIVLNTSNTSYVSASSGAYNSIYAAYAAGLVSNNVAQYVYAIRINPEWAGPISTYQSAIYNGTPAANGSNRIVTAAQFIGAFQNFSTAIKSNAGTSHIKVCWDYPCQLADTSIAIDTSYYPGNNFVDIITCDTYFYAPWNNGGNGASVWTFRLSQMNYDMTKWAAFAVANGKPIGAFEWGDNHGDGVCITNFINWMAANNCVFNVYWDATNGLGGEEIQSTAGQQTAYEALSVATAYGGTEFAHLTAPGSPIAAGF